MKKTITINGHPVAITDSDLRNLQGELDGKRKPKLKRAADRAWVQLYKTVADFQPKGKR